MDAILATAHTLSKDLLCSGCGQPRHEAWNPDAAGFYEVHEAECFACSELAADEKRHKDGEYQLERKVWVAEHKDHPHGKLKPYTIGRAATGSG